MSRKLIFESDRLISDPFIVRSKTSCPVLTNSRLHARILYLNTKAIKKNAKYQKRRIFLPDKYMNEDQFTLYSQKKGINVTKRRIQSILSSHAELPMYDNNLVPQDHKLLYLQKRIHKHNMTSCYCYNINEEMKRL